MAKTKKAIPQVAINHNEDYKKAYEFLKANDPYRSLYALACKEISSKNKIISQLREGVLSYEEKVKDLCIKGALAELKINDLKEIINILKKSRKDLIIALLNKGFEENDNLSDLPMTDEATFEEVETKNGK